MSWFKVDDGLHSSRKVLSIPRSIRLQSIGLWTLAGSWAAKELTDGHVPDYVVAELGGTPKMVDALVRSGLWEEVPDGANFHDWAGYQPTRAQVMEQRDKDAERKREARGRGAESRRSPSGQIAESDLPVPSRPDPIKNKTYTSGPVPERESYPQGTDEGESVEALCERQASAMGVDFPKVKIAIGKACGRFPDPTGVMRIIATVLARAKPPVKSPTGVVLTAIRNDWAEWQQFLDEEGVA